MQIKMLCCICEDKGYLVCQGGNSLYHSKAIQTTARTGKHKMLLFHLAQTLGSKGFLFFLWPMPQNCVAFSQPTG